eukprot:CAMPEP_0174251228 /NCGR_PEP_ID=MMETSP0439-20130205/1118_1 /TAXON_ID=0 /ORGANISM="Stereomyxa ramosa, Strain Chinc5" /LENGTH=959 /DNA_ID=CAMNT_0015331495 /DNA_START=18 /DNA_END=2897 /DNA_ORIENTATION=+
MSYVQGDGEAVEYVYEDEDGVEYLYEDEEFDDADVVYDDDAENEETELDEAELLWQMIQQQQAQEAAGFEEERELLLMREQNLAEQNNGIEYQEGEEDDGIISQLGEELLDPSTILIGPEVAEGAFGKVFKASYLGADVAVKKIFMDGDIIENEKYLVREVAALSGIRHPNVVTFIGCCVKDGDTYIVTEWIERGDLTHQLIDDQVYISWSKRVRWALDTAAAMAYLHTNDIIHRDLKAANLLLTDNDRIKVCDMGFARRKTTRRARSMSIAGTELYMAPEVITGKQYDSSCDVFCYGVVLYEIITRQPPPERTLKTMFGFDLEEIEETIPAECPDKLKALCLQCLETDETKRPNFRDIVEVLVKLAKRLAEGSRIVREQRLDTELQKRLREEKERIRKEIQEQVSKEKEKMMENTLKQLELEAERNKEEQERIKKQNKLAIEEQAKQIELEMRKKIENEIRMKIQQEERERRMQEMKRKRLKKEQKLKQKQERRAKKRKEEEERRKKAEEEERKKKEAEEVERKKKEAEEAERKKKEAEEAARKKKEAEAERKKKEAEEEERKKKEAEDAERKKKEAEEKERKKKEDAEEAEEEARKKKEIEDEARRKELEDEDEDEVLRTNESEDAANSQPQSDHYDEDEPPEDEDGMMKALELKLKEKEKMEQQRAERLKKFELKQLAEREKKKAKAQSQKELERQKKRRELKQNILQQNVQLYGGLTLNKYTSVSQIDELDRKEEQEERKLIAAAKLCRSNSWSPPTSPRMVAESVIEDKSKTTSSKLESVKGSALASSRRARMRQRISTIRKKRKSRKNTKRVMEDLTNSDDETERQDTKRVEGMRSPVMYRPRKEFLCARASAKIDTAPLVRTKRKSIIGNFRKSGSEETILENTKEDMNKPKEKVNKKKRTSTNEKSKLNHNKESVHTNSATEKDKDKGKNAKQNKNSGAEATAVNGDDWTI